MTEPGEVAALDRDARWRAWARWVVLVVGFMGLVLVARQALSADEDALPSVGAAAAAIVLYIGAGAAAARGWSTLLRGHVDPMDARGAMYASQLSKYVPAGGLLQAAGQVVLSTSPTASARRVTVVWVTSIALTVVAGLALIGATALAGGFDGWLRAIGSAGLLALLLLRRDNLVWALDRARRLTKRIPDPALVPGDRALRIATAWNAASILLSAGSFTVILVDLDSGVRPLEVVPAFIAGWLVGFLLVPLPGGLGAREAVIVALVPGVSSGVLLAASLDQRVLALVAEVTLLVGHRIARRVRSPAPR